MVNDILKKQRKRKLHVRKALHATIPRLHVYRSNKHVYAQIIDDAKGKTIVASSDLAIKKPSTTKVLRAKEVGKLIAEKAIKEKIKQVVFDRGSYKYHGRVKELATGAREGGLEF